MLPSGSSIPSAVIILASLWYHLVTLVWPEWHVDVRAVDPGEVSLTFHIQLYVIHVEEVADGCSISEPISETTLCNDLDEGVQASSKQQGNRATPWYMLHLMLGWAIGLELASRVDFHRPIELLRKALSVLLICIAESTPVSMSYWVVGVPGLTDCPVRQ